ncbi:hypothetical protein GCM10023328_47240 [Modestobacter marinus]|uniref:Telomere-binding protein n=1 Tax=Modestobacter marinus TaxID=477641 RepID=A0ABQ2GCH9_9ACTN|nr:hypothetical protein GCM10011589_47400 [Modestobacter marinus]
MSESLAGDVARGPRTSLRRVVERLEAPHLRPLRGYHGQDVFQAPCPVHDDASPSLAVRWVSGGGRGQVLLRCHGCNADFDDLAAALGLSPSDFFDEAPQQSHADRIGVRAGRSPQQRRAGQRRGRLGPLPKPIAKPVHTETQTEEPQHTWVTVETYPYTDAQGHLVQEVIREQCTTCPTPHKAFRQVFVVGDRRVKRKPEVFTAVLYRLPQVMAGVAAGTTVWLLEGEKDVAAAETLGLLATTNAQGGRSFSAELAEALRGADVRVVLDRDDTGWDRGVAAHRELTAVGASVELLLPAPTAAKSDFSDHVEAGHALDELVPVHLEEVAAWAALALVRSKAAGVEQTLAETQAQLAVAGESGGAEGEEALRFARRWAQEAEIRHEALDSALDAVRSHTARTGTVWAEEALTTAGDLRRQATTAARAALQLVGQPVPPALQLSAPVDVAAGEAATATVTATNLTAASMPKPESATEQTAGRFNRRDSDLTVDGAAIAQPLFRIVNHQIVQVDREKRRGKDTDEEGEEGLKLVLGLDVQILEMEYLEDAVAIDVDVPQLRGRESRLTQTVLNPPAPAELSGLVLSFTHPTSGEVMQLRISADQWRDASWMEALPGQPDYDGKPAGLATVRRAIKAVSPDIRMTTRYRSTGWRELPDVGWCFVHAGGGISAAGAQEMPVLLTGPLARYDLPDPTVDAAALRAAFVEHSAGMLTRLPARVTAPMLGQVYRSALGPNPWVLALIGSPGSYKTSIASLGMHHWGELWDRRKPASSMSGNGDTLNALRIKLNAAKDALYWADDVAPTKDWLAAQKLLEEFARLVHNGEQRSRSTRDGLGVLDGTPPRSSAMVTSEVMPRPGSGAQRMLVVPLQAEEISLDALIALDGEASRHGRALLMASMLQWLAADLTSHKTRYAQEALRYAEQLRGEGEAVRQAEAVGTMWSGWCAMSDFLVEVQAITTAEQEQLLARVDEALGQAVAATADPDMPSRTGARVRELLCHALRSGAAYVEDVRTGEPPPWPLAGRLGWRRVAVGLDEFGTPRYKMEARGTRFGYVMHDPDGRDGGAQLLVDSTALEQVLKATAGTMADAVQLDRGTAIRALYDEGVLIAEERAGTTPRFTVQRTLHCEDRRQRVTALRLWELLGEEGDTDGTLTFPEGPDLDPDDGGDDQLPVDDVTETAHAGVEAAAAALFGPTAFDGSQQTGLASPAPTQGLTSPADEQEHDAMAQLYSDAEGTEAVAEILEDSQPCQACGRPCAARFAGVVLHIPCWMRSTAASRAPRPTAAQATAEPATKTPAPTQAPAAAAAPTKPTSSSSAPAAAAAAPSSPATAPARPASTRGRRTAPAAAVAFTAPAAVAHTDGVWLPDGTCHELPADLTHIGQLAELVHDLQLGTQVTSWRSEPGQLWLTGELLAALGVDITALPEEPTERVEAIYQLTQGAPLVELARGEGWELGGSGDGLRGWTRVWRGERRGVWIALIPAMNEDPLETPVLADAPDPATLARRLALFAEQLQAPWAMGPSATGIDLMINLRWKDRERFFAPREPVPPAQVSTLEQDINWSRVPTEDEQSARFIHAYDRGGSYAAGVAGLELGVGEAEHHPEGRAFDPKLPGYWKIEVPEGAGDWRFPHPLIPRGSAPAQPIWLTTPGLQLAWELGYEPDVLAAYVWPEHARVLDPWYERIRDARAGLDTDDVDAQRARDLLKTVYTRTIGMLGSETFMAGRMGYDPARRHHIVAKARANILRRIVQIGRDTDRWPVAVTADTVLYLSNDPDPVTAWPGKPAQLGRGLGQFKPEASGLLVDQLPHLTGKGYKGKELLGEPGAVEPGAGEH